MKRRFFLSVGGGERRKFKFRRMRLLTYGTGLNTGASNIQPVGARDGKLGQKRATWVEGAW